VLSKAVQTSAVQRSLAISRFFVWVSLHDNSMSNVLDTFSCVWMLKSSVT